MMRINQPDQKLEEIRWLNRSWQLTFPLSLNVTNLKVKVVSWISLWPRIDQVPWFIGMNCNQTINSINECCISERRPHWKYSWLNWLVLAGLVRNMLLRANRKRSFWLHCEFAVVSFSAQRRNRETGQPSTMSSPETRYRCCNEYEKIDLNNTNNLPSPIAAFLVCE